MGAFASFGIAVVGGCRIVNQFVLIQLSCAAIVELFIQKHIRVACDLGLGRTVIMAMGADQGVHINDPAAEGSDSLATAKLLAAALKDIPYELIIAGHRAVDEDNYQVAAAVAELLRIPQVSMVNKVELADGKIICDRTIEGGTVVVEASLPALFTTQRGLNEPRYASLPGIMKAKKKPVDVKTVADLGVDPSQVGAANRKVKIKSMSLPPERQAVRMVEGEAAADKAAALVKILHGETKII